MVKAQIPPGTVSFLSAGLETLRQSKHLRQHKNQQDATLRAEQPHTRVRPHSTAMLLHHEKLKQEFDPATQPERNCALVFTAITDASTRSCLTDSAFLLPLRAWPCLFSPCPPPLRAPLSPEPAPLSASPWVPQPGQWLPCLISCLVSCLQVCRALCSRWLSHCGGSCHPALGEQMLSSGTTAGSFKQL